MSKATMERIKALAMLLDPAETAVLAGWLMKQVEMNVPAKADKRCPHHDGEACHYPEVA